jgi:hypothetical protein
MPEKIMFIVAALFKGITLNKKGALILIRSDFLKRASLSGVAIV